MGRPMSDHIGYVVLAKRPNRDPGPDDLTHDYQPAGSVRPTLTPVENHRAYCEMKAEGEPHRYGNVEYVIGHVALHEERP